MIRTQGSDLIDQQPIPLHLSTTLENIVYLKSSFEYDNHATTDNKDHPLRWTQDDFYTWVCTKQDTHINSNPAVPLAAGNAIGNSAGDGCFSVSGGDENTVIPQTAQEKLEISTLESYKMQPR